MTTGANYEQPRPKRPISQSAESLASWCPCDHCRDVNTQQNGPSQPKLTLVSLDASTSSVPVPLAIAPKERSFSRTKSKRKSSNLRVGPLAPGQTAARFDPTEAGEARQLRAYMKLCARQVNLASIHQVMLSDSDTNGFKEYHTAAQERVTKIRRALRRERNSIVRVAMGLARAISDLTPSILFLVTTIPLLEDWAEPNNMDQMTLDTDMDTMLEELQRIARDIDPDNIGILCAIDRAVVARALRKPQGLRAEDHQAKVAGHLYRYYASHKTMNASISADSYRHFSPKDEVLNTNTLSSWERYQIFVQRLPAPDTYRHFPPNDEVLKTDPLSSWEREQISSQRLSAPGKIGDMYQRTILHDVATHIDDASSDAVRRFRYLLRREDPRRPHINSRDYLGRSALHILSARGLTAATRELVEAGADPNAVDCAKRTPLHWSVAQGAGSLIPLVIPDKVTPCALHQIDAAQSSPMHLAARVYEINPRRGISVDHLRVIHQFSLQHQDNSFQHLENPIDTETEACKQLQGWGMLHFAAANGWTETLHALLDNGIVVDDYHSRSGHTALSIAAQRGNVKAVQYLLSRHGFLSPNDRDNGRTAISYAAENGNVDILQLLLQHPRCAMLADQPDHAGCTPLFHAVTAGRKDAVQLLLLAGAANPRIATNANTTPLSVALKGKDEEMIRMLKDPPPLRATRAAPPSSLTPSLRRLIGPDAPPRMPAPAFLNSGRGSRQGRTSDGSSMWGLDLPPGFDGLERRTSDASLRSFNSFSTSLYAMSEYRADRGAPSARSSLSLAGLMVETVYDLPYRQNSQTRHDLPWISQEDEYRE